MNNLLMGILAVGLLPHALSADDTTGSSAIGGTTAPVAVATRLPGFLGGVTRDPSSGRPVPQAQVTVHNIDKNTNRTVVSGADGAFAVADLEPGRYDVAATKDGFTRSSATLDIAAMGMYRLDLPLAIVTVAKVTPRVAPALTPVIAKAQSHVAANADRDEQSADGGQATAPPPAPPAAPSAHKLPEALQAPDSTPGVDNFTPFAYGDFTWLNGTPRNKDTVLDTKFFTPEVRFDTHFMEDFNQPMDHTMGGATESFRSGEFQVEQISVGGDFHWQNVRGRILTMYGLFATTTPRNDASAGVGQWDVRGAYKYVSEAYGGYHFNVNHGLNVDAGIFVSYIGLFSYYNFDNWTYQPSFVSSNTPWFFNGLRIQWFPTNKLKIEPWIINGWQSYNKFNGHRGLGGQILWRAEGVASSWSSTTTATERIRWAIPAARASTPTTASRSDTTTIRRATGISKMAFSLTGDAGL